MAMVNDKFTFFLNIFIDLKTNLNMKQKNYNSQNKIKINWYIKLTFD